MRKSLRTALALSVAVGGTTFATQASATAEPLLGQIMEVGYSFCPRGWANADGSLLAISQNQALFSLYGNEFGGDGRTTFALPDLRGRASIHVGSGPGLNTYRLGQRGGAESVTLNIAQIPSHDHPHTHVAGIKTVADAPNTNNPAGNSLAMQPAGENIYSTASPKPNNLGPRFMDRDTVFVQNGTSSNGGSQSHENRMPFTVTRKCVALVGLYPSRN